MPLLGSMELEKINLRTKNRRNEKVTPSGHLAGFCFVFCFCFFMASDSSRCQPCSALNTTLGKSESPIPEPTMTHLSGRYFRVGSDTEYGLTTR